jgi:hypothetical protein
MDSDKLGQAIYSAGECPVCADSGALLLLKAHGSGSVFFFCPVCGVAWREPPAARQLDTILRLDQIASHGVTLPTIDEARSTGVELNAVSFDEWYPLLKELLG